jgi:GNAT superfamily N-acetyltransferase
VLWEDEVTLADGGRIYLRVVRPSDRPTFEEGWEHLSAETRLFRFLAPRDHLSDGDLDYLTDVDGVDHYAIGAVTRDATGHEGPVAVARIVRLLGRPTEAEFAVTVVDEHQRRGVGSVMLERLRVAALKRGITVLRADLLPANEAAARLIRKVVPRARSRLQGSLLCFEMPLEDEEDAERGADTGETETP